MKEMKKTRTREEILKELQELQEELFEYEENEEFEEELEEYREYCNKFAKQMEILQEETGFTTEECLKLIELGLINNGK